MKLKTSIIIAISTCTLAVGAVALVSTSQYLNPVIANNNYYKFIIDKENRITAGYKNDETETIINTQLGNPISLMYKRVSYSMKGDQWFGQFENSRGYIYNVTPLSYIGGITVTFESNKPMQIAVGNTPNPTKFQNIVSGIPIKFDETCNYFTLKSADAASNVKDISIEYLCKKGGAGPDIPGGDDDSSTSESTPIPGGSKILTISCESINGIIPTSYTSSGVKFKQDDINFFGNYITDGINVSAHKNYTFLREGGRGFIMNTNPIKGLSSISLDSSVNPSSLEVYASNDFNQNWTKIKTTSTTISFSNSYSYFKIKTSDVCQNELGFKSLSINYENADVSLINEVYNIKKVDPISQEMADSLVTTSSEKFVNSDQWVNKGYARDINEANNDKTNKKQSGYDQYADYQTVYNPNLIVDEHYKSYRVADMSYGDNGNSFRINMIDGTQGPVIYKDCAYTYIEDIAAYITAFGDAPVNMRYKADSKASITDWGTDGRTNYAAYSNDNSKKRFKYETECSTHRYFFDAKQNNTDYWYNYFESDYGASIPNTEPYQKNGEYKDKLHVYNDGSTITRGALRFVWSKSFTSSEHNSQETAKITNAYDRNVFYSSTHYADFQQYLNYYHGWSIRFGNSTLGNVWNEYVADNHLHASPEVTLVSLNDLLK